MGFLKNLSSRILGKTDDNRQVENRNCNSISNQGDLMNAIELVLKRNYKGQQTNFNNKMLKIWTFDTLMYDSLKESRFIQELAYFLDNQMGINFHSIDLIPGSGPVNTSFTEVAENVYIEIRKKNVQIAARNAEISIVNNYGSLKKEKYVLDAYEIETLPAKRYNIGIGEVPDVRGRFRINQIAIDDDPSCSGFERNKYVSRTHAYIRYSSNDGFLLQAETEGTTKAGMRTRILRENGVIDVDDVVAQPLKDGDCIELSRNVRLMFKIVE